MSWPESGQCPALMPEAFGKRAELAVAVYVVVFAGGTGERMNTRSTPKQFLQIHGQTILQHTLRHFLYHQEVDGVVVVCLRDWMSVATSQLSSEIAEGRVRVVPGGATTQESVFNGLDCLRAAASPEDAVLVHDAVRPLIDGPLISSVLESVRRHGNGITVSPQNETIVSIGEDGTIGEVLQRSSSRVAKAPQGFVFGDLLAAHDEARAAGVSDYVDSASLMHAHGHRLYPVDGSPENIKVTTPTDFYIVRAVLDAQEAQQVFGLHVAAIEREEAGPSAGKR